MKSIRILAALTAALMLASCTAGTAEEETAAAITEEVTEEVTEEAAVSEETAAAETTAASKTETEAEETEETVEEVEEEAAENTSAELISVYGKILYDLAQEGKVEVHDDEHLPIMGGADIIFCDFDLDGTPELFAGSHGITGWMNGNVYSSHGVNYGWFSCAIDLPLYIINNEVYTAGYSVSAYAYTKLVPGMPYVDIIRSYDTENVTVLYYASQRDDELPEPTEVYEDVPEADVPEILKETLGADVMGYDSSHGIDYIPMVWVSLPVPDMNNYTLEDIENSIAPHIEKFLTMPDANTISETAPSETNEPKNIALTETTKFYECALTPENVIYSEDEFSDKELLEKARQAARDKMTEDIGDREIPGDMQENGILKADMQKALTCDMDGDGKYEYAFVFQRELLPGETAPFQDTAVLVFAGPDGAVSAAQRSYSYDNDLLELRYNGFSHAVMTGFGSIADTRADIYSFSDNAFELELEQFGFGVHDGIFLSCGMAQAPYSWLIFWNEDEKCYVTPTAEPLSDEDNAELQKFIEESPDKFEGVSLNGSYVVGNKYYSLPVGLYFNKDSGQFAEDDNHIAAYSKSGASDDYMPVAEAENFDYNRALANVIPLE